MISKNVIYTNGYSMHEEHRANPKQKYYIYIYNIVRRRLVRYDVPLM